jgi:hypothetical protein
MRTRLTVGTTIALALVVALLPARVASAAPARATVSIGSVVSGFSGTVTSTRHACARGRVVTLWRQRTATSPGERVASTVADTQEADPDTWEWHINVSAESRQGYLFYAAVRRNRICRPAKSRTVDGKPPVPRV